MGLIHKFKVFDKIYKQELTPIKAIRKNCLDCCAGSSSEVKLCNIQTCPLWPYRLGKNPCVKHRKLSDEARKRVGERLKKSRE